MCVSREWIGGRENMAVNYREEAYLKELRICVQRVFPTSLPKTQFAGGFITSSR